MPSAKKIGRRAQEGVASAVDEIIKNAPKPDMKDDGAELKAAVAPKNDLNFSEAFKANRMAGNKTFTWKGKSYTTKMVGEGAKRSAPSKPAAKSASAPAKPAVTQAKPAATQAKPDAKIDTRFTGKMGAITPRTMEKPKEKPAQSQSQRFNARAAELSREAQQEARAEKAKGSEGARARLKNLFGFGSAAAERASKSYSRAAEGVGRQERALASKPKQRLLLTGEEARKANKGTIGGYAKGGKIDGCAIRGKTRAMKKGK